MERAIVLAWKSQAYVYVVFVVDRPNLKAEVIQTWDLQGLTEKRKSKLKMVEKAARKEGINYEVKIIRGEPAIAIIKLAEEVTAELIVVGSRGLNPFQQMLLGSVSHRIMKRANCSVLIVK
jgi:nucleotide-binding universal stress UspA family protein